MSINGIVFLISIFMGSSLIYTNTIGLENGSEIGGSGVHFPSAPVQCLADLRNGANSQRYSSIYEDQRPKIEDIETSDGKKSA